MRKLVKDLWFAVFMILAVSAVLLVSDLANRKKNPNPEKTKYPSIAVLQFSSTLLLDRHVAGVIDRLTTRGYVAPGGENIRRFNAQGELSMANLMAQEIVNGSYAMVITSSTTMLQTFAKTNQDKGKIHVFGAVTDPYGTGVGITGKEPADHPPYMAGIGTFQPVTAAFHLLRQFNPEIKRAGVVWNPGEQCSDACVRLARQICDELGIELIEAIATSTTEVAEATRSLLAKGVEVIWIGGDTVANSSARMIINLAAEVGIPVITNDPSDAKNGALFGLGANYFTVGQYTGAMAADILDGKKPSEFRIENVVPELLDVNHEVLAKLRKPWNLPRSVKDILDRQSGSNPAGNQILDFALLKQNHSTVTPEDLEKASVFHNLHEKNGKPVRITLINLVENHTLEEAIAGVEEGLKESGLVGGTDYIMKKYSAQGEIGQLPQIIDAVVQDKPDLIITVTTPALIATARKVTDIPVVFTVASDPVKLGIFDNGRPDNICGIYDNPRMGQLLTMAVKYGKGLKTVGTVFDPAQVNSMISVERLRATGKEQGIRILEAPASAVSDLAMATRSLVDRGAKALLLSADNLVFTGLAVILKETKKAGIPVYVTDLEMIDEGVDGGIGVTYRDWGKQSGRLAAKVAAGVPPARLPVAETENQKVVEPKGAR